MQLTLKEFREQTEHLPEDSYIVIESAYMLDGFRDVADLHPCSLDIIDNEIRVCQEFQKSAD